MSVGKEVIIVIPVYREKINAFDMISLQQLIKILNQYKLCIMAPASLNLDEYMKYHKFLVERFPNSVFNTQNTYSECLLDINFYERFLPYKYILLYQLDAFVFSDKLMHFCNLDYDYIGAPIPRSGWPNMPTRVGNGGASLRKVHSFIKLLKTISINSIKEKIKCVEKPEDAIFSYCTTVEKYKFKGAPYKIAQSFAVDYDVRHLYNHIENDLPFLNHAWYKTDYNYWKPIIEKYGYIVPDVPEEKKIPMKWYLLTSVLMNRLLREKSRLPCEYLENIKRAFAFKECAVWGWGRMGKKYLEFLDMCSVEVLSIFDEKKDGCYDNILVRYPYKNDLLKYRGRILVLTTKYEAEIRRKLEEMNMKKNVDFMLWSEVSLRIAREYLRGMLGAYKK